jgi:hypothetical protein
MTVCLHDGVVVGFVDAEPGEVTRLFILPEAMSSSPRVRLISGARRTRSDHRSFPVSSDEALGVNE